MKIKVTQKDCLCIALLVTCLLYYPIVLYVYVIKYFGGVDLLSWKAALLTSGIFLFIWMFYITLKNLIELLYHKENLIIDKQKRSIIYNDVEVNAAKIDHADVFTRNVPKGIVYNLVFYPRLKVNTASLEIEEESLESNAFYVFQPSLTAKLLMIQLANEINAMTIKRRNISYKMRIGDLVGLVYIVYLSAIFLIVLIGLPFCYYFFFIEHLLG